MFNVGAVYRAPIYHLLDERLHCDFYIGDAVNTPLKLMDYNSLNGFKSTLHNLKIGPFIWRKGFKAALNRDYEAFVMTGEPNCLSDWFTIFWARFYRKKVIVWCHGWYGDEGMIKKLIKKIQFRLCTNVLLYGDRARNLMIQNGIEPNKLVCIYNSLDYSNQLMVRNSLKQTDVYKKHFGNNNPVILYIGRLQKVKKLDMRINAMAQLRDRGIQTNFVCIGKDIEGVGISNMAEKQGLKNNVWEYGPLFEEEKIGEMMFNSTICVSPGNVGLTAMHCLMYGLPVITHNNFANQMPEFESVQDGESGSFFKEDSVEDLAKKIDYWVSLSNSLSREQIASRCHRIIDEKYNPNYQIKVFESIL